MHELAHAEQNGDAIKNEYYDGPTQRLVIGQPEDAARNADSYGLYTPRICADKQGRIPPTCAENKKFCSLSTEKVKLRTTRVKHGADT